MLRKNVFDAAQLETVARDFRSAGLPPDEVAMMSFAQKLVLDASEVTRADVDELRRHGLDDTEILDIAMVAGARSFFSKVLDALGAEPNAVYMELEEGVREALAMGRPFEGDREKE